MQQSKANASANGALSGRTKNGAKTRRRSDRGLRAIWQARLALLVMINIAQLWILSGTVEAALAREYKQLPPLVVGSLVCWLIALSIFLWWRPASHDFTSTGYMKNQ